jgi:hypothetical protein
MLELRLGIPNIIEHPRKIEQRVDFRRPTLYKPSSLIKCNYCKHKQHLWHRLLIVFKVQYIPRKLGNPGINPTGIAENPDYDTSMILLPPFPDRAIPPVMSCR